MIKITERCISKLQGQELAPLPESLLCMLSGLLSVQAHQATAVRCLVTIAEACVKSGVDLTPLASEDGLVSLMSKFVSSALLKC